MALKKPITLDTEVETDTVCGMEDYQQRVVDEKRELDVKIEKLEAFISDGTGNIFRNLDTAERRLLHAQRNVMRDYSQILGQRIAAFQE